MSATLTEKTDLTMTEAAVVAGVAEDTVRRWIRLGRLAARKNRVNGRVTVSRPDVERIRAGEPVVVPTA